MAINVKPMTGDDHSTLLISLPKSAMEHAMTWNPDDFVIDALGRSGVTARRLDAAEARALSVRVLETFGLRLNGFFWDKEGPHDSVSVRNVDGEEMIPDFVGARPCFFISMYAKQIWAFASGDDLRAALAQMYMSEFSVCDAEVSYLLCFNHHDYLIGWGDARTWVSLKPEKID